MRKLCRVLFSRYAISAVMIVLEIILMVYLFLSASTYSYIALIATVVSDIAVLLAIVNRDANPEYKLTWSVVVLVLPLLGALLYVIFYRRRMTRREVKFVNGLFAQTNSYRGDGSAFSELQEADSLASGKARAIINDDPISEVYRGTSSEFFSEGADFFESMIADLEAAKDYIFLEYFIIDEGKLWDKIHGILREKAASGIEVRILYDDIGCMKTLPAYYEYTLRAEGIKAYRFAKVNPRVSSVHNNRNHRKICVIDGKVGYTGGVNIADEYVNIKERFGYWKDGGIKLCGDAVRGLVKQFLTTWDYTTKTVSDYEKYLAGVSTRNDADGGYYIPFGSGPAPIYERQAGKNVFLNLINQAQKYLYITTPYLIIDYDLTESLCNAALRGVDVRIITPGIADKKIVKIMTKSSYPHLIEAGVKIYEYTPGFIHEKTLISDDNYAVVGTINFDYRSLVHHYENAIWMYSTPTVYVAKHEFLKTLEKSSEVDSKKSKLTFVEWIFRNGIKIFAPLL